MEGLQRSRSTSIPWSFSIHERIFVGSPFKRPPDQENWNNLDQNGGSAFKRSHRCTHAIASKIDYDFDYDRDRTTFKRDQKVI